MSESDDVSEALKVAMRDLERAYREIGLLKQWARACEDRSDALVRDRERIVKALEAIWGYEPIATSHPTCMATCYGGTWIQKSTAIAIVRGEANAAH